MEDELEQYFFPFSAAVRCLIGKGFRLRVPSRLVNTHIERRGRARADVPQWLISAFSSLLLRYTACACMYIQTKDGQA